MRTLEPPMIYVTNDLKLLFYYNLLTYFRSLYIVRVSAGRLQWRLYNVAKGLFIFFKNKVRGTREGM